MKIVIFNLLFFLFLPMLGFSQNLVSGKIIDEENKPLPGANITINQVNRDIILAFAVSDSEGEYELKLKTKFDTLEIKVSFLGYTQARTLISTSNQKLNFKLKPSSKELKEVFIKAPPNPITQNGDTLSYAIDAFKNQKDRVIADVLKKLPGIEVDRQGKITYQGKAIQKYYIEGLDLLDGKYNLANNNLPADAVAKVQILQNHQPIRVLDSLEFSDRTSLNIKLKKNITTTGSAKLGGGMKPFLWAVNLTPMLFTKQQQMLTSYQTNNIGDDVARDLNVLTIENLFDEQDKNTQKSDWLDVQRLSIPNFSKKRWLNNKVHLISSNYLLRLKKDFNVKINISYLNDIQKRQGETKTRIFTPTDTLTIFEKTENKFFLNSLQGKFSLVKNTKKNYFKNDFEFKNYWDSKNGFVLRSDLEVSQKVQNPFTSLNDRFKWILALGKKKTLVTFYSNFGYTNTNQKLKINLGVFDKLLNEGEPFEQTQQTSNLSNFYTENALSLTKRVKKFSFTPKFGFDSQNQDLRTTLQIWENKTIKLLEGDFQNNLKFQKALFYTSLNTQFKNKSWIITLFTPIKWRKFAVNDAVLNKNKKLNRLTIEPSLSINKELNAFWKVRLSVDLKNDFGGINKLYYSFILNSYRNIQRYNSSIPQKFRQNYKINLIYSNPIKSFFATLSYTFVRSKNNLLEQSIFETNGALILETLEQDNFSQTQLYNLQLSKYFSEIHTTFSWNSNWSFSERQNLVNGMISDVKNENLQFNGKVNAEITDWLSLNYKNKFSFINSKIAQKSIGQIKLVEHLFNFNLFPNDRQYIGFEVELYKNSFLKQRQVNYFFNLNYTYSFAKKKFDLEIKYLNIFNNRRFNNTFNTSFTYLQTSFLLRPSQILATFKFNF